MRQGQLDALPGLAFAPDDLADLRELFRHALVGGDDVVERIGDLAGEPGAIIWQTDRKIAESNGLQRVQYVALVQTLFSLPPGSVPVRAERRDDAGVDPGLD